MHPALYQFPGTCPDPNVLQVVFADGVGMIEIVFTQYSFGMKICLDSDIAGATTLNTLAFNLSFPIRLLHRIGFPPHSVAHATECLAC